MATTYNNLFLDTRARLKKAGVESAQLEAREIICFAADKSLKYSALVSSGCTSPLTRTNSSTCQSRWPR